MALHIVCIAAIVLCAAGYSDPPPQHDQGYWPPEDMVREALEEFDAYPKPEAFMGLGVKDRVEEVRQDYEADGQIPEAEWVEYWMDKSDEFIWNMISPENPRSLVPNYNQGCPLHKGNIRTLVPVWGKRDTFRCMEGGEEWAPGMMVKNPGTGEMVQIVDDGQGWQPPEGFPQHQKFYFRAAYRLFLIRMLIGDPYTGVVDFDGPDPDDHRAAVESLAWAYAASGEQKYADRALLILNRLAENYRWYNGRVDTKVDWRKFNNRGYIGDGIFESGKIKTFARAYDLVFDAIDGADAVMEFFALKNNADYDGDGDTDTEDLRYNIEHNLFGYTWEFFKRSYKRGTSNAKMFQMAGMANLALVFQNDAIIEELIEGPCGVRHGVIGSFFRGGRSHEDSSSYSRSVNNAYLDIARLLSAYKGREIYTDGLDVYDEFGSRFSMIDSWMDRASCDGIYLTYGDGGSGHHRAHPEETGDCAPTLIAHELGLTFMRLGENPHTKLHALLYHPVGGVGHGHRDELMLKLSKYGYDFTADIGYPANLGSQKRRRWVDNSITHPVVIIDETRQNSGVTCSEDAFVSCDWAQMQSAYSYDTYPEAQLYHRTAVAVQVDPDRHFVIDIFRVIGGSKHDLPFHSLSGDEGRLFELTCDDMLADRPGTLAGEDVEYQSMTSNGYSYITDLREGMVEDAFSATWRVGDDEGSGYRLSLPAQDERVLITGRGENKGTAGKSPLDAYMILQRTGEEPLASTFIIVHEPFQQQPMGLLVERIPMERHEDSQMPAGVKIITGAGEEFILQSILGEWDRDRYTGPQSLKLTGPAGSVQVNWPSDSPGILRGEIVEVDYGNNRMLVQSEQDLSNIAGEILYIQNPGYAKAAAFDVAEVEQAPHGRWWIETKLEPIIGSNAIQEVNAEKRQIISPYNIAKQRECKHLMDNKPLISSVDPETIVRLETLRTDFGDVPTQTVRLPEGTDMEKFEASGTYQIYDFGPGDTIYICNPENS